MKEFNVSVGFLLDLSIIHASIQYLHLSTTDMLSGSAPIQLQADNTFAIVSTCHSQKVRGVALYHLYLCLIIWQLQCYSMLYSMLYSTLLRSTFSHLSMFAHIHTIQTVVSFAKIQTSFNAPSYRSPKSHSTNTRKCPWVGPVELLLIPIPKQVSLH